MIPVNLDRVAPKTQFSKNFSVGTSRSEGEIDPALSNGPPRPYLSVCRSIIGGNEGRCLCSFARIPKIAVFPALTSETTKGAKVAAHANFVENQAYEEPFWSLRMTSLHSNE
jgi:hypothetical protein